MKSLNEFKKDVKYYFDNGEIGTAERFVKAGKDSLSESEYEQLSYYLIQLKSKKTKTKIKPEKAGIKEVKK